MLSDQLLASETPMAITPEPFKGIGWEGARQLSSAVAFCRLAASVILTG
jgi:hypothetical protein